MPRKPLPSDIKSVSELTFEEVKTGLENDLFALTQIHELSGKLLGTSGMQPLLQEILEGAVSIMEAQRGTLQILEEGSLQRLASYGYQQSFLDFFFHNENQVSACNETLKSQQRVIVPDVESSPIFAGKPSLEVLREAGIRAVQCTPIISRSGVTLGILSTHWDTPHSPDEHDLWRIDLLVRFAADLIEHKKVEEALKESEERANALIKYAPTGIYELDYRGPRITSVNNAMCILTGFSREEFLTMNPMEMLTEKSQKLFTERIKRQLAGEKIDDKVDFEVVKKDRSIIHVTLNISFSKKNPFSALVIGHDITERKKAEEALAKAKDELETRVEERTEQLQEAFDEIMRSHKALMEAHKQLKQYADKITQVQEEERKRIAYELHDDTAQYLGILKMQIGALADSEEVQNPLIKEKLRFLERDADRAFRDVRRYSHELRPVALEHHGLAAALEQIVEDYKKLGQFSIDIRVEGVEPDLSEKMKLGFFRIAQEALNNVRKHARASLVNIELRFNQKQIKMLVSDNGTGFKIREALKRSGGKGSLGLLSMRERADLINADLKIESQPGKGTRVTLKTKNPEVNSKSN